ncbi:MAG: homoserine dehydrogenase [Actinomycetota bacterium]|nr:homoserine dehydrogenase [Actinomycetota bacterium]
MKKDINIGLLGLGTVGSGVYKILTRHHDDFALKVGANLNIKAILERDITKADAVGADRSLITNDASSIIDDPDIDIVVEVLGGIEPARTFILKAIESGKHIVTANKELLASYGKDIFEAADAKGVDVYFEASVGGGIPIIHPLKECLASNKIIKVMGIVNGTTNYVLTRMAEEGCLFKEALEEAQAKGYAERDPSADIEGRDAAAKIAILASIAFNSRVTSPDVYMEGISRVTPEDIMYAGEMGYVIKLIALAKEEKDGLDVRVHPAMIPRDHPLASVRGVYNAIFVEGDAVGEVMFFGPGAGSMPAASAVVGDILDVARNLQYGRSGKVGCTCFETKKIKKIEEINSGYYLLMNVVDRPGVLAKIAKAFGDNDVSLASVIQKGPRGANAELVFVTHLTREKNLRVALKAIEGLDVVNEVCNVIRVEGPNG